MTFIYNVISSGMVTYADVVGGQVSLAALVEMSHYLEMRNDIQRYQFDKEMHDKPQERGPRRW